MITGTSPSDATRGATTRLAIAAIALTAMWPASHSMAQVPSHPEYAESLPADKGYRIAARSDRSDRSDAGFVDSSVPVTMVLRNREGREHRRELTIQTLEVPDEDRGDKSLIVFRSPPDIDGTAL